MDVEISSMAFADFIGNWWKRSDDPTHVRHTAVRDWLLMVWKNWSLYLFISLSVTLTTICEYRSYPASNISIRVLYFGAQCI
mmetsp:Transcript_19662/g.36876  ORF Transcript_19662/g.36876 Transcript_19662/m.36876 type:complete len:82 (+) Transcript_19662:1400-1645(+)